MIVSQEYVDKRLYTNSLINRMIIDSLINSMNMWQEKPYSDLINKSKYNNQLPLTREGIIYASECLRLVYGEREGDMRRMLFKKRKLGIDYEE
jgi:hypothetical protein